eukprot:scaffold1541_cov67-Phaeocystis_antarctica.AAC.6
MPHAVDQVRALDRRLRVNVDAATARRRGQNARPLSWRWCKALQKRGGGFESWQPRMPVPVLHHCSSRGGEGRVFGRVSNERCRLRHETPRLFASWRHQFVPAGQPAPDGAVENVALVVAWAAEQPHKAREIPTNASHERRQLHADKVAVDHREYQLSVSQPRILLVADPPQGLHATVPRLRLVHAVFGAERDSHVRALENIARAHRAHHRAVDAQLGYVGRSEEGASLHSEFRRKVERLESGRLLSRAAGDTSLAFPVLVIDALALAPVRKRREEPAALVHGLRVQCRPFRGSVRRGIPRRAVTQLGCECCVPIRLRRPRVVHPIGRELARASLPYQGGNQRSMTLTRETPGGNSPQASGG